MTDLDLSNGSAEGELAFVFNPEAFLCEGSPVLDDDGKPTFESTEFTTSERASVDRMVCDFVAGWDDNNSAERTIDITSGGLITSACERGQLGPLRDCGFSESAGSLAAVGCVPGESANVSCTLAADAPPVVVRVCEYSEVLGVGTACVFRDAVLNQVLEAGGGELTIECPPARNSTTEPGGMVALYAAPLLPGDELATLDCTLEAL